MCEGSTAKGFFLVEGLYKGQHHGIDPCPALDRGPWPVVVCRKDARACSGALSAYGAGATIAFTVDKNGPLIASELVGCSMPRCAVVDHGGISSSLVVTHC